MREDRAVYSCENYFRKWGKSSDLGGAPNNYREDLYSAGFMGFLSAIQGFDPEKGKLLTYATHFIDWEIEKEGKKFRNPFGTGDTARLFKGRETKEKLEQDVWDALQEFEAKKHKKDAHSLENKQDSPPVGEKFSAERRVLQILEILRLSTDEENRLTKEELRKLLIQYRVGKYRKSTKIETFNTLTSTLEDMIMELSPLEYSKENEDKYQLKYEGYRENLLKKKLEKKKGEKAPEITGFFYGHLFRNEELDLLIQLIAISDMISKEEKENLMKKLLKTGSPYYKNASFDREELQFQTNAIHSRFSSRHLKERVFFSENIKVIQKGISSLHLIRFRFNRYEEHKIVKKYDYVFEILPLHLVVYQDIYYCIGLKTNDYGKGKIWHFRVDLMWDIEPIVDEKGNSVRGELSDLINSSVLHCFWNPEKYMAEHLYMAYDEPEEIKMKIKSTDYLVLYEFFGEHYETIKREKGIDENGAQVQYDTVVVKTSPEMIIPWALQHGDLVEIVNDDIREKIEEELKKLLKKYQKGTKK